LRSKLFRALADESVPEVSRIIMAMLKS